MDRVASASLRRSVEDLRRDLRNLQRRARRARSMSATPVPDSVQIETVVVHLLSNTTRWPLLYCAQWQSSHRRQGQMQRDITEAVLQSWLQKWAAHEAVDHLLHDLNAPRRLLMDRFLMESLVFEFLEDATRKGLPVPSSILVARYLQYWSYRPIPAAFAPELARLAECQKKRRCWARRFRRRWGVSWTRSVPGHGESLESRKDKVPESLRFLASSLGE
jgi:hypothetical protein